MRKLQEFCLAGIFTFVLSTPSFAGDIETPGKIQAPPPATSSTVASGDIQTGDEIQNSVAYIALNLLQTMLSVF